MNSTTIEPKPNQSTDLVLQEIWRINDELSAARGYACIASSPKPATSRVAPVIAQTSRRSGLESRRRSMRRGASPELTQCGLHLKTSSR